MLEGTDFEPFHDVFEGAYGRFTQAISTAQKYGLGVLVGTYPQPRDYFIIDIV